jgi:hypothetical protein
MMPDKVTRILIILAEIFWVGLIISGTIQRGLPTNPVFWIAVVIEVALGFLTYNAYKRYLVNKSYKRWNLIILVLTVIGIGVPIALFYLVDFLKPAGGTWIIYLLTVNSFYLYRIIKKEPISRQDVPVGRLPTVSKVLHSVFLATVPIMILVVALLPVFGYVPVFSSNEPDLVLTEIVFAVIILPVLVVGLYLHWLVGRIWKTDKSDMYVYFVHGIRVSLFEAVAVFGLILGILGGALYVWLPLLMLAGAAMVFTFPTAKRWEEWKAGRTRGRE